MSFASLIREELQTASAVIDAYLADEANLAYLEQVAHMLVTTLQANGKIITCGNGGSHCDAMHFAEELSGRFRENRPALAAIAISDPAHLSCTANDFGYEEVFARYVEAIGQAGDVLVCISTSGNSPNVLRAADRAHAKGLKVLALTGNEGGQLAAKADYELRVPYSGYADRIQEMHIKLIHMLILLIEKMMF
ncbi:MAG TPA: phosphoheptose isomerase [Cytophagales bacterium]|nr:phosphoheptose isomerase [Cytophagales bacterium]HAA24416.1 phosphoheptose isomerase [Cytophagales bacterium]HAP59683.1 phosphoheptose isomerase [Cytophagales bacterium]